MRRWEARRQAAWALLDGRLTLRQAAARFRDIDAELPYEARGRRPPQYSEEEWPYRQVISYVHTELVTRRGAPAQAEAWVARLEAELREHRRPESERRRCPLMVLEVLASYPEAVVTGLGPDRQVLLLLYPELADLIGGFFAGPDRPEQRPAR